MNTEQLKQINTHLALIEAEMGRIRVMIREATVPLPDGIIGNTSDSPYVEQPDYTHLLPEGYEFCAEGDAEKWVKVENNILTGYSVGDILLGTPMGDLRKNSRPIRSIQYHVAVHEAVTVADEHECKHCGAMTSQPDEQCYKNPYKVDWSNAPDWADVHAFDEDGEGYWCGVRQGDISWMDENEQSPFTLPDGLDWKLSKTYRPQ